MNIPAFGAAPRDYDQVNEQAFREAMRRALATAFTKGQDVEIGNGRLIMTDTVTSARYALTVSSGTLTVTAV